MTLWCRLWVGWAVLGLHHEAGKLFEWTGVCAATMACFAVTIESGCSWQQDGLEVYSCGTSNWPLACLLVDSVTSSYECDVCMGNFDLQAAKYSVRSNTLVHLKAEGSVRENRAQTPAVTMSPCLPPDFQFEILAACGIGSFLSSVR